MTALVRDDSLPGGHNAELPIADCRAADADAVAADAGMNNKSKEKKPTLVLFRPCWPSALVWCGDW